MRHGRPKAAAKREWGRPRRTAPLQGKQQAKREDKRKEKKKKPDSTLLLLEREEGAVDAHAAAGRLRRRRAASRAAAAAAAAGRGARPPSRSLPHANHRVQHLERVGHLDHASRLRPEQAPDNDRRRRGGSGLRTRLAGGGGGGGGLVLLARGGARGGGLVGAGAGVVVADVDEDELSFLVWCLGAFGASAERGERVSARRAGGRGSRRRRRRRFCRVFVVESCFCLLTGCSRNSSPDALAGSSGSASAAALMALGSRSRTEERRMAFRRDFAVFAVWCCLCLIDGVDTGAMR